MKATIILAALAASLLAGTDVSAQGKGYGKGQKKQHSSARQGSSHRYHNYDGYGKNHGSYQGRGRKVGHYRNDVRNDRDVVYGDRPVIYRGNPQPVPQPLPQPTRDRTVWDIFGTR